VTLIFLCVLNVENLFPPTNPIDDYCCLSGCLQDECTAILKTISHQINSEHSELQSHRLLSIFKMSEVEVVWPESTSAAARSGHGPGQLAGCQSRRLLFAAMMAVAYLSSWTTLRMSDVAT